ncbi:MAG: T9SS type A sorting domain-containing protein, partial [Bacteroidia bacterium]
IYIYLIIFFCIKINHAQDGTIDSTFNIGNGFNDIVHDIKIQADGKIIAVGNFTTYNGNNCNRIVRINPNGSIDNSFQIGNGFDSWAFAIALQTDGKIIIGGNFSSYKDTLIGARIIRLNQDGTIDNSFNTGTGLGNAVFAIKIQNDGKIVVGGQFQNYDTSIVEKIVRINQNGSIDNTFNIGTGFSGFNTFVRCLSIDNDDKIIVGGTFNIYNGNNANNIVRLNTDGSYDPSFSIGSGFNSYILDVLPINNKYLITGDFTNYNGNTANRIVMLNNNGSIDSGFIIGSGFNAVSGTILMQTDNKFLISGSFSTYNGNNTGKIIKLNSNGSIDNSFSVNINLIPKICLQSDNKIIAYGNFTSPTNRIVRLNNTLSSINENNFIPTFTIYPNPSSSLINIKSDMQIEKEYEIILYDFCGKQVYNKKATLGVNTIKQINTLNFPSGLYFIKLKNSEQEHSFKIVIE